MAATWRRRDRIDDLEIFTDGRVPPGAENFRGAPGFVGAYFAGVVRRQGHAAEIAGGEVGAVDFPAGLFEQQQRAGGHELEVVGMSEEGKGDRHGAMLTP
jgi:hypothetical protein